MKQIPLSFSLLSFLDELEFTEAALSADPDAEDLAAPFREEIAGWSDVFHKERSARREVTRSDAVIAVRNAQLDRTTTRFGGVLHVEAGQDRKSTLFRRFFPVAPSEFIRQALRKQCERTRDTILPELAKLPEGSPLHAFAGPLEKGSKAALAALNHRSKVKGEASGVANDVTEWKEGVNRLRTTTYAELLKLTTEKGYGKAWVETFFRADASASASAGDAGETTASATESSTAAPAPGA